jgi:integrase
LARLKLVDLEAHISAMQTHGWAPMTLRREVAYLRAFFKWCIAHEFCGTNPATSLPSYPSVATRESHALRGPEIARLLAGCRDAYTVRVERDGVVWAVEQRPPAWLYPVVLTAVRTLLRMGAILSLRWSDVDLERRVISIQARNQKNRKFHTVPIAEDLHAWLLDHTRGPEDLVHPDAPDRVAVWRAYKRVVDRLGLDATFHDLRRTGATWLLEQGVPVPVVQRLGGWTRPTVLLEYYARVHDDSLRQAAERLGGLGTPL